MFSVGKRKEYVDLDYTNSEQTFVQTVSWSRKVVPIISIGIGFAALTSIILFVNSKSESGNFDSNILLEARNFEGKNENLNITQVKISHGKLEGIVLKSRYGRNYSAFYNIPYAKPAVGNLRFEPPQELTEGWTGVRDATKVGGSCIQASLSRSDDAVSGEEDCQYLSIYTPIIFGPLPNRPPKKLLPVMVYFLGGMFLKGQASIYGGQYMMDKDVVIVLPETRFGVMGFLSTGDDIIPGNMGFKDQTMVLKWVKNNISKFGGNPKKVTIFGNSSGSMSVHLHLMSDLSTGLFHRAISQSGVGITSPNTSIDLDPILNTVKIASALGCPILNSTRSIANCLKLANASNIIQAAGKEISPIVVEAPSETAFLTNTPLNIMTSVAQTELKGSTTKVNDLNKSVPWILGVNSNEMNIMSGGLAAMSEPMIQYLNTNWENYAPGLLNLGDGKNNISREIKQFYFGSNLISNETRLNFTNLVNDRTYFHPTYLTAKLRATSDSVFLYVLTKKPIKSLGSFLEDIYEPPYGVTHADEVQYFFPYAKFPYIGLDSEDLRMSEELVNIWTEFADSGKPHKSWEAVKAGSKATEVNWFQLDDEMRMINFAGERMEFWDRFPPEYLYV